MNARTDTTAAHSSLYSALAAAQAEMGRARKDSKNPHFKSSYADLASVMDACMPVLTRHGIAVIQPTGEDDGGRYVETILVHGESGQMTVCRVPLIVSKNDMQGYGSAVTYARRYGLMSMACIAADDDDGNAAAKAPPPREEPRRRSGPPQEDFDAASGSLAQAETQSALRAIWDGLPKSVQAHPDVIAAKDKRKDDLKARDEAEAGPILTDDEIPDFAYEGHGRA